MSGFVLKDQANCIVQAPDGTDFIEFSCLFTRLTPLYFSFEKYHEADKHAVLNYIPLKLWLESSVFPPVIAVVLYALFCYFGQKYMASRKALNLRKPMAVWNLFLSTYSALTVVRGFPGFYMLATNTIKETLLLDLMQYGGSGDLWTILFVLSKFAELFDTFFIVVHKKPLIFLHWWHHITVLLYAWTAFQAKTPSAVFFGPVNAAVHAVMYFYYFLMAVNMKPKWMNAIWITVAQLLQMVMGVYVSLASFYYYMTDERCTVSVVVLWSAFFMYGSYLYLFGAFFYGRYVKRNKNTSFAGMSMNKKQA